MLPPRQPATPGPQLLVGLKGFSYEDGAGGDEAGTGGAGEAEAGEDDAGEAGAEGDEAAEDTRPRREDFEAGISVGYQGHLFSFHIPSREKDLL